VSLSQSCAAVEYLLPDKFPHPASADFLDNPTVADHCPFAQDDERLCLILVLMIFRHGNIPALMDCNGNYELWDKNSTISN
jgi:hypothetical protein